MSISTSKQMVQSISSVRAFMDANCHFDIEESLALPQAKELLKDSWLEPELRVYHQYSFVKIADEDTPLVASLFRLTHGAANLLETHQDSKVVAVPLGTEGAKEIVFMSIDEAQFFELEEINIKCDPATGAASIAAFDIESYDLEGYKAH